ncbi:MAG: VTT domain-containing protein [Acidobacteria bacterium]|nr:VTT domain-containing protein [Acidobacteriota bacterium]
MTTPLDSSSATLVVAGIVLSAFVSEDGAILGAAALASSMVLNLPSAALGAFLGLWISDFGVYGAVRLLRERLPQDSRSAQWLEARLFDPGRNHARRSGQLALAFSRLAPGTRLPAYISAGLLRMPVPTFAAITGISAAAWIALIFSLFHFFPLHAMATGEALATAGSIGFAASGILAVWRIWGSKLRRQLAGTVRKWRRWEFWPAWVFYPPVALMCGWLAIRFRGLTLPTAANPSQRNGGMVGESKIGILQELMRSSPDFTADAYLLTPGPLVKRMQELEFLFQSHEFSFPFILKPDVAQRGAGFKKIGSWRAAAAYLAQVRTPVLLQKYVSGPNEAGFFYYRFPGQERGRIFSITHKTFPVVVGDGHKTLRELIAQDDRATIMASTYLARFRERADEIVPCGERIRLVEAGNHCQGCIFSDGSFLDSEELRRTFDSIARKLPQFFIGRFDVRYASPDALRQGRGFHIIELNGAASEATDIYDARNPLLSAYRTLYRQWELVYRIGAANRERGFTPTSLWCFLRDCWDFRAQASYYPLAD